jgi:hypothetical protein
MANGSRTPGSPVTIGPTSRPSLVSGPSPLSHDVRAPIGSPQRPSDVLCYESRSTHGQNRTEADVATQARENKLIWPL